jgi:hypothetical protein
VPYPVGAKSPGDLQKILQQALADKGGREERPESFGGYTQGVPIQSPGDFRFAGDRIARGLNGAFGQDAQQAAAGKDKEKQRYFQEMGKLISSSPVMPEYSGGGPVRPNSDRREVA